MTPKWPHVSILVKPPVVVSTGGPGIDDRACQLPVLSVRTAAAARLALNPLGGWAHYVVASRCRKSAAARWIPNWPEGMWSKLPRSSVVTAMPEAASWSRQILEFSGSADVSPRACNRSKRCVAAEVDLAARCEIADRQGDVDSER